MPAAIGLKPGSARRSLAGCAGSGRGGYRDDGQILSAVEEVRLVAVVAGVLQAVEEHVERPA